MDFKVTDRVDQGSGLSVRPLFARWHKVAAQSFPEIPCLSDINDRAQPVFMQVDTRFMGDL